MLLLGPCLAWTCTATLAHDDIQAQVTADAHVSVRVPASAGVCVDVCCLYYNKGPRKPCIEI